MKILSCSSGGLVDKDRLVSKKQIKEDHVREYFVVSTLL